MVNCMIYIVVQSELNYYFNCDEPIQIYKRKPRITRNPQASIPQLLNGSCCSVNEAVFVWGQLLAVSEQKELSFRILSALLSFHVPLSLCISASLHLGLSLHCKDSASEAGRGGNVGGGGGSETLIRVNTSLRIMGS